MSVKQPVLPILALAFLAACGPSAEEQQAARDEGIRFARADSTAQAEVLYDPAGFDTITWASPDSALSRGTTVFLYSCRRCHGSTGLGDGDLAQEHGIVMPDVTAAGWQFAGDLEGIRHRVFVGHESEMPNWGLHGLPYRDVDAVARYILTRLRGE
ncbi:MAG: cytochrome c [Gemmatimonadota bacterium]|nr:cytochrome c [Gemmatimonadota bacterium]